MSKKQIGRTTCPRCDGEGWVCDDPMQTQCPPGSHRDCPTCKGSGTATHQPEGDAR